MIHNSYLRVFKSGKRVSEANSKIIIKTLINEFKKEKKETENGNKTNQVNYLNYRTLSISERSCLYIIGSGCSKTYSEYMCMQERVI